MRKPRTGAALGLRFERERVNRDGEYIPSLKASSPLRDETKPSWMLVAAKDGTSNVSISVGKVPPVEADINARNLESAIYNLLLNARQAATRSTHAPEVKVFI